MLSNLIPTKDITTSPKKCTIGTQSVYIYFKDDNKTEIRIYSTSSAVNQFNVSSTLYYYLGLRGYDFGNGKPVEPPLTTTEWLYKYSDGVSGTFVVPRSGYYYIELYGGGGAACGTNGVYASGGASCQSYDSVYFSISEKIPFTIGAGGISNNAAGTNFSRGKGGTTTFGTYSIAGATGGAGYFDNRASSPTLGQVIITSVGKGSGNLGKDGAKTNGSTNIVGSGKYSSVCGASGTGGNGVAGGIYIKYLRD